MRNLIALLLSLTGIGACSQRVALEPLARGLEAAWHPVPHTLKLAVRPESKNGHMILHCVLSNVYWQSIDVDASSLPWVTPYVFSVDAVTAGGKVLHKDPPPEVAQIHGAPRPVAIAAGESMEGDVELKDLPTPVLPRSEDLLVLWSYSIGDGHAAGGGAFTELSGVTFLKET